MRAFLALAAGIGTLGPAPDASRDGVVVRIDHQEHRLAGPDLEIAISVTPFKDGIRVGSRHAHAEASA
jgi:hypothetical protein